MRNLLGKQEDQINDNTAIFSLSTYSYLEGIPEGYQLLREGFMSRQPEMPCAEQIPELISSVRELVKAVSFNAPPSAGHEAFGVREASLKLRCSPGQVRTLVHEGKLQHHWQGKNLRFRQTDLEQFWASQTRIGADKTSSKRLSKVRHREESETKQRDSEASSLPTRREVDKLWR